ncbi:hypothetical protein MKZ38_009368 [Zalerion maritima]|uniref:adenine phosphoribosyltransferase n=1 Tax=Zalerion maritima TaxID=339359 RepID=A0AAD5RGL4_9PEZI|nr:hypothetical protein MKZ38_009368 [Zalerion maritima]
MTTDDSVAQEQQQQQQATTTTATNLDSQDASGRKSTTATSTSSELAGVKVTITKSLRRFADFPIPGIDFVDIMPLFHDPVAHATLLRALQLQVSEMFPNDKPDIVVGLDARGFLFGPALALQLGAGFTAVRKKGKLPGPCITAEYIKEYGKDFFQMQEDGIEKGQKVLVVDDIIATGGSATAAGDLVKQLGGDLMGFLFILEIPGLKGRDKLDNVPVSILIEES